MKKIKQAISRFSSDEFLIRKLKVVPEKYYILLILLLGIIIRGRQYLANRSFWLDEAFLANNIKFKSFSELLEPLEYSQVAPIGFLWAEKLMATVFGLSELSLRFLPFLVSILTIYLLYDLCKTLLGTKLAIVIALVFTLPLELVYFSSELKQYMFDLFSALLLFWFYFRFLYDKNNNLGVILIGILGGLLIWISNVTPIILTSIGLAIFLDIIRNFDRNRILAVISAFSFWLLSFFTYYIYFIHNHPTRENMKSYWSNLFMPLDISLTPKWLIKTFDDFFRNTIGHYEMSNYFIVLFIVGIAYLFVTKKYKLLYLLVPLVIHLILSAMAIYPFGSRLVLYLVPFVLIFEVLGIYAIGATVRFSLPIMLFLSPFVFWIYPFKSGLELILIPLTLVLILGGIFLITNRAKKSMAVVLFLTAILFTPAFLRTTYYFRYPRMGEDIKPVLAYVASHKNREDIVYIYSGSHAAFRYYKDTYFSKDDHCIMGVSSGDDYKKFIKEFNLLENRIWIIFSHMNPPQGIQYFDEVIPSFEQLDYFESAGAKTYLINK